MKLAMDTTMSYQSVKKTLGVIFQNHPIPSVETIIKWELAIGLYKLITVPFNENRVWIIDFFVTRSNFKCLIILGVDLNKIQLNENKTIDLSQTEVLHIMPMRHATKILVNEQLEVLKNRTGLPKYIVSDGGSDVKSGSSLFCINNPSVFWVSAILK